MAEAANSQAGVSADAQHEGKGDQFMDVDRMVNEGLGGGQVTAQNGLIDETTTDTMEKDEEQ
jgi:hypothetical protein